MGQSKSKHILLVEDYDPVRELIANMLEDRGYRVSTVPAGGSMRDFLPVDDRVKFGHEATQLGTSISQAFDAIGKTFDSLDKKYKGPPELDRAFNAESACKGL